MPSDDPALTATDVDQAGSAGPRPVPAGLARVGRPIAKPASATLTLYAGDWAHFSAWCRRQGGRPLPAMAEIVAAYLLAMAPTLGRGALGRRRAAINAMHRQAGLPPPTLDAAARKAVRISTKAHPPRKPAPPTPALLVRLAARCPRDLAGLRDRAILLLVAATARRPRSGIRDDVRQADENAGTVPRLFLLALDAEHIRFTTDGVAIQIKARSDESDPSRTLTLARSQAAQACPVRALEDWLRTSETVYGPVFRKVDRWGNVEHGRLGPDAWHRILARRTGRPIRSTPAEPA